MPGPRSYAANVGYGWEVDVDRGAHPTDICAMNSDAIDTQVSWIIYGALGILCAGCCVIGLWQWKAKPRWYIAYAIWTAYLWGYCAFGSYLADPTRYAGSKFIATLFAPLPFSAVAVAAIWIAIRRGRQIVGTAESAVNED